jgi:hypothetical protein
MKGRKISREISAEEFEYKEKIFNEAAEKFGWEFVKFNEISERFEYRKLQERMYFQINPRTMTAHFNHVHRLMRFIFNQTVDDVLGILEQPFVVVDGELTYPRILTRYKPKAEDFTLSLF